MNKVASAAVWAALVAAGAVAGCSSPRISNNEASLPGACQFMACVCASDDAAFWQDPPTAAIVWLESGQASCPAGFSLKRAAKK